MGQKAIKEVLWGKRAIKQLHAIYLYIAQDSSQNAIKVRTVIYNAIHKAAAYPEQYALDKLKRYNDGTYRSFIKYKYKISYRVSARAIKIIRIRHTKRRPSMY